MWFVKAYLELWCMSPKRNHSWRHREKIKNRAIITWRRDIKENRNTRVFSAMCSIRRILQAPLMLLSSSSYKCKWQQVPFSQTHSWRGLLEHHSSLHLTSAVTLTLSLTLPNKHTHKLWGTPIWYIYKLHIDVPSSRKARTLTLNYFHGLLLVRVYLSFLVKPPLFLSLF